MRYRTESDVVVSIVTNSDEDWSFGNGRAQFLTGELEASSPMTFMSKERSRRPTFSSTL
jgi:hypothetical protein